MNGFQAVLVFVVLLGAGALWLMARLSQDGFSTLIMRLKSRFGEFELLASKNQADSIVAQNRLPSANESKRPGIEN